MQRPLHILSLAALLGLACTAQVDACPTCKNALHDGLLLGYAISILFMMAMPFAIFAFWVVTIWRLRSQAMANVDDSVSLLDFELAVSETSAR